MLENICSSTKDNYSYARKLTEEEITETRENLEQDMLLMQEEELLFSAKKKEFNEKMAKLKKKVGVSLGHLRTKSELLTGVVYEVVDHETERMQIISPEGEILSSRPLQASERQAQLFQLKNAQ
jgi:hypothetical protein